MKEEVVRGERFGTEGIGGEESGKICKDKVGISLIDRGIEI
jgi:hypothetical protein